MHEKLVCVKIRWFSRDLLLCRCSQKRVNEATATAAIENNEVAPEDLGALGAK